MRLDRRKLAGRVLATGSAEGALYCEATVAGLDLQQTLTRANALLEEWELADEQQVDVVAAFGAAELHLSANVPKGCEGYTSFNLRGWPDVRLSFQGDARAVQRRAMHEAGHLAKWFGGDRLPHHELSATRAGLCVAMPEKKLAEILKGGVPDPDTLLAAYPLQYFADIMERVALHYEGWCYHFTARLGLEVANDHSSPLAAELLAHEVRAELLRTGQVYVRFQDGRVGVHYEATGRAGLVVMVPAKAVEENRETLIRRFG